MIAELASEVFSRLCHQQPDRAWMLGGESLPLCARCTGVYVGAVFAAMTLPLARFAPSRRMLWLHGAMILQMVFLGLHIVGEQPAWVRTLSGAVFALGTVYFLWLPVRTVFHSADSRPRVYAFAACMAVATTQLLVRIDALAAARTLEALALLGIVVFPVLALTSTMAIALSFAVRRRPA